ncbi:serine/threonine-protein kinase PINK1, mitochondrial isoform X3 [Lingula anatina]|uniref:non-specific serine/threonine protein kinase n=1 Tax=Lingula anatina TaxID=7574 RepID=A0A2R2MRR1_LINAN|nr:serine/threonine-protein kinase PINK1, mitochondrial isoform X3 [Lingula anatina]|eukprot:XP_023932941.1 serine/threonine-protein kinase PINK1, mitochondrial isoform X3 [Lingula anatina]
MRQKLLALFKRGKELWGRVGKVHGRGEGLESAFGYPARELVTRQEAWKTSVRSYFKLPAQIHRVAAQRFAALNQVRSGGRVPALGLVGFGLVSNLNASEAKTEDLLCSEIQELFKSSYEKVEAKPCSTEIGFCLEDYTFGNIIAKGCNAAVYEAKLTGSNTSLSLNDYDIPKEEELSTFNTDVAMKTLEDAVLDDQVKVTEISQSEQSSEVMSSGDEADFSFCSDDDLESGTQGLNHQDNNTSADCNLAVKVMFNYHVASNAELILREMSKEMVPAKMAASNTDMDMWENGNRVKKKMKLPPHPNIVDMRQVFVGDVLELKDCLKEFPCPLPQRINPEGCGRNMTMYLVMKRYSCTLEEYLTTHSPSLETRILVLAQLLEAVVHMGRHGIAHRDLKANNILVDLQDNRDSSPQVVVTDFGNCLCDQENGLVIPYWTSEVGKGGNPALMAPEIACASPGQCSYLDYRKADLWAVGTLAFQIFGLTNPFHGQGLDSRFYKEEDLPCLPDNIPVLIKMAVYSMLMRDPNERPEADTIANLLHLYLWQEHLLPLGWSVLTSGGNQNQNNLQRGILMTWLLTLTAEVVFSPGRSFCSHMNCRQQLKRSLLRRADMTGLLKAVEFLEACC